MIHPPHLSSARPTVPARTTIPQANQPGKPPVTNRDSATARLRAALEKMDTAVRTRAGTENVGAGMDWPAAFAALDAGADPDTRTGDGWTPLMQAVREGRQEALEELLTRCAHPDGMDGRGRTPLMQAARAGHTAMVTLLIAAGADREARDRNGWSALACAAWGGHAETIAAILAHSADPTAACGERIQGGWTPLACAACQGHAAVAALLIEHGADPNARDDVGRTALMVTSNPRLAALLIDHGADPTARDVRGRTAMECLTALDRCPGIVSLLIVRGIDPAAHATAVNKTLPEYFALAGRTDLLEELDETLARHENAVARRRLLDRLPAEAHPLLPRCCAVAAQTGVRPGWGRPPHP